MIMFNVYWLVDWSYDSKKKKGEIISLVCYFMILLFLSRTSISCVYVNLKKDWSYLAWNMIKTVFVDRKSDEIDTKDRVWFYEIRVV